MRKIPRRYAGVVMGAFMAFSMGLIMSFIVTFLNLGFSDDFLRRWAVGFMGTLPIGFPVAIVVTPFVRALIGRITE